MSANGLHPGKRLVQFFKVGQCRFCSSDLLHLILHRRDGDVGYYDGEG